MVCKKCGDIIEENEKFCSNCGTKVTEEVEFSNLNNNDKKLKKVIIALMGCIAILAVVLVVVICIDKSSKTNGNVSHNGINEENEQSAENIDISEKNVPTPENSDEKDDESLENNDNKSSQKIEYQIDELVEFGKYEDEIIQWKVIDSRSDGVLLWSTHCVTAHPYHYSSEDEVSWETCELRKWLNQDFYEKVFSPEEKKHIKKTVLENNDCENTTDKIFMLSAKDINDYDLWGEDIVGYPSQNAVEEGIFVNSGSFESSAQGTTWYWLRGNYEREPYYNADVMTSKGDISYNIEVVDDTIGVRVALWYSYDEIKENQNDTDYILPRSDQRFVLDTELNRLSKDDLRIARNEIYARHGYCFKNKDLDKYFSNKDWYVANFKHPEYIDSLMNIYEKYNIQAIVAKENGEKYDGEYFSYFDGYEDISDDVEDTFNGTIDLYYMEYFLGTYYDYDSDKKIKVTTDHFGKYPYRILKMDYDIILDTVEIAIVIYYEDVIIAEIEYNNDEIKTMYYDMYGNPAMEDGYVMEPIWYNKIWE